MKIAINHDYGGWALTNQMVRELGYDTNVTDRYDVEDKINVMICN